MDQLKNNTHDDIFEANERLLKMQKEIIKAVGKIGAPFAQLTEESLKAGYEQRLFEQNVIHSPTFLSILPSLNPSSFMTAIYFPENNYRKSLYITQYHTVKQTVEDLLLDSKQASRTIFHSSPFFPFQRVIIIFHELVSFKGAVRTLLLSSL